MVKEFTIDRSKWLRGEGSADSFLVRASDGKMCCLGFYGKACGILKKEMRGMQEPDEVGQKFEDAAPWLFDGVSGPSGVCATLMRENDTVGGVGRDRERKVKELFAEHGVKVKFVGK